MAAPTTRLTNGAGTITTAGEANGFLIQTNTKVENPVLTLGVSSGGAFTSVVLAIRSKITGLTNYYPIPVLKQTDNTVPSNSAAITLTNSTPVAFQMSIDGYDETEVYVVSGTFASGMDIEANIGSGNGAAPITVAVNTGTAGSFTNIDATGTLTVDGATLLGAALDVTGASTFASTVGITGVTTLTGGSVQPDNAILYFGTGNDIGVKWDATDLLVSQAAADSFIKWGVSGAGINHTFYGDTATRDMTWDQTNNQLLFADNALLAIGSGGGAAGDIAFSWDATRLNVTQLTANSEIRWGVDAAGIDQMWYGDTASTFMNWDQSADSLILNGAAPLVFTGTTGQPRISLTDNLADALSIGIAASTDLLVLTTTNDAESVVATGLRTVGTTAVAISGATTLKLSDSGGIFTVAQSSAYDVDLPSPTSGPGCSYEFSLTAPGANDVTVTVAGGAATFVGILQNDVTGTVPCTGATLTYKSGVAALGDMIQVRSIATNLYRAFAICQANGGITIT